MSEARLFDSYVLNLRVMSHSLIARLREQISLTRWNRMSAQLTVATSNVLEVALERTSRDRSSGATSETDAL